MTAAVGDALAAAGLDRADHVIVELAHMQGPRRRCGAGSTGISRRPSSTA